MLTCHRHFCLDAEGKGGHACILACKSGLTSPGGAVQCKAAPVWRRGLAHRLGAVLAHSPCGLKICSPGSPGWWRPLSKQRARLACTHPSLRWQCASLLATCGKADTVLHDRHRKGAYVLHVKLPPNNGVQQDHRQMWCCKTAAEWSRAACMHRGALAGQRRRWELDASAILRQKCWIGVQRPSCLPRACWPSSSDEAGQQLGPA